MYIEKKFTSYCMYVFYDGAILKQKRYLNYQCEFYIIKGGRRGE
ncbi:hypothetical protein bcere0002_24110 [Bacillus cereus ATCC 10876]|nr:hypothetical protein bcere0002_24110 [Bacillus cereus ATCC 10876]KZD48700.1 hypothetical protein B4084_1822 [Bacillus cereus]